MFRAFPKAKRVILMCMIFVLSDHLSQVVLLLYGFVQLSDIQLDSLTFIF